MGLPAAIGDVRSHEEVPPPARLRSRSRVDGVANVTQTVGVTSRDATHRVDVTGACAQFVRRKPCERDGPRAARTASLRSATPARWRACLCDHCVDRGRRLRTVHLCWSGQARRSKAAPTRSDSTQQSRQPAPNHRSSLSRLPRRGLRISTMPKRMATEPITAHTARPVMNEPPITPVPWPTHSAPTRQSTTPTALRARTLPPRPHAPSKRYGAAARGESTASRTRATRSTSAPRAR
jgi:hypothetical protein